MAKLESKGNKVCVSCGEQISLRYLLCPHCKVEQPELSQDNSLQPSKISIVGKKSGLFFFMLFVCLLIIVVIQHKPEVQERQTPEELAKSLALAEQEQSLKANTSQQSLNFESQNQENSLKETLTKRVDPSKSLSTSKPVPRTTPSPAQVKSKIVSLSRFSENVRYQIFYTLNDKADLALAEAYKLFPRTDPRSPNYNEKEDIELLGKQTEYSDKQEKKYVAEVLKKYNLSEDDMWKIINEGHAKKWKAPGVWDGASRLDDMKEFPLW